MLETFYAHKPVEIAFFLAISLWLPAARVDCGHPITPLDTPCLTPLESGQKHSQTDYRHMARGSHGQSRSQMVMGPRAQEGPEGGPEGVLRGPKGTP
jgi:hypothetical protein